MNLGYIQNNTNKCYHLAFESFSWLLKGKKCIHVLKCYFTNHINIFIIKINRLISSCQFLEA